MTPATYFHLIEGRKRHRELASAGAVGVYLSHLATCDEGGPVRIASDLQVISFTDPTSPPIFDE